MIASSKLNKFVQEIQAFLKPEQVLNTDIDRYLYETDATSLFKNQVVSFLVSLIICYVFYLGFDAISSQFDAPLDLLFQNIGIKSHYISIQRGVLDSRDIMYYLSMILFFLLLTRFALQSRKW